MMKVWAWESGTEFEVEFDDSYWTTSTGRLHINDLS